MGHVHPACLWCSLIVSTKSGKRPCDPESISNGLKIELYGQRSLPEERTISCSEWCPIAGGIVESELVIEQCRRLFDSNIVLVRSNMISSRASFNQCPASFVANFENQRFQIEMSKTG
eukprot:Blabericola_migrator_1__6363@NODE_3209_length_1948_cov_8_602871_g2009_i0_p4_GENE_NODE_3209_length_1948_cov_8_602871_g2009_i0NODE_3209_length_1948_cov_8_602871_g2009_i0_p4_ORF_typecomplete_len118_score5_33zfC2HC5/PF06221_13/0_11_NODE_3209_length_1948_cov_8_602871_g2009_i015271880